jgi:hypothetical protein
MSIYCVDISTQHVSFVLERIVTATLLLNEGKLEEAEAQFKSVLRIQPDNVAAIVGCADTLRLLSKNKEFD